VSTEPDTGVLGTAALPFHSDGAFSPVPLRAISLHAVDVVDGASATRFASGARTLQRLPDEVRRQIVGRESLHVLPLHVDRRNRASDVPDDFPRAQHPIVLSDPDSGREGVFLCEEMLDGIVGMPVEESDALIDAILAVHHVEDNVIEHPWHGDDIVIWNNLLVQHGRSEMSSVGRRTLQRVSVGTHGPMDFAYDLDLTNYPTATGR
jgi:taurine dioxygenase